ncbi:MAG: LIC_10190 family membrane protein, partial [Acidobacteriota bacterium]
MLRQYGVLKGAALIHQRFGFSSSWFALATPFPAQTISGLTMLIVFGHLLALLRRIYQGVRTGMPESGQHSYRSRPADRFIVIAYLLAIPYLVMGNGLANSLSPDLPVAIGVIIFCWWILATGNSSRQRLSLMILALGLFAVKLSTLPLVLIAILNFLILSPLSWRRWLATGLLAILVSGPVLTVNILTSGCPLYPSGAGCLEQLPWSYSSAEAERLRQLSTNYARTEGRSAEIDPQGAWIIDWMIDDFTGSLTSMAFLTLVSVAAILLLLILYPRLEMRSEDRLVFTIGAVGLVYVLAMAPSLRFGIGYAVIIPSLILSRLNWKSSVLVPMIGSAVVLLTPFTELEHRKVRLAI